LSKKLEELIVQESNFGNTNVTIVMTMLYVMGCSHRSSRSGAF